MTEARLEKSMPKFEPQSIFVSGRLFYRMGSLTLFINMSSGLRTAYRGGVR